MRKRSCSFRPALCQTVCAARAGGFIAAVLFFSLRYYGANFHPVTLGVYSDEGQVGG